VDGLPEHRQADQTLGVYPDCPGEFRRVIYGNRDQIVGADFLNGEIPAARFRASATGLVLRGGQSPENDYGKCE
jgi:hypothetical protein